MKKNIFNIANGAKTLIASCALLIGVSSCSDMLTVDSGDKLYTNANDTLYSYLGILKCVQDVAERQVLLGELRGDLVSTTTQVTDTLHAISNFDDPQDGSCSLLNISDYYNIINNCNLYIANADTAAVKSNIKYMIPEFAQVQAIRAWTYLQLVQNYGSVPFITDPISSLDVVKNFDYEGNQVTRKDLINRILETNITDFLDTEYPQYETFDNGAVNIASRKMMFPIRLILADMYLLRGQSQDDYLQAAKYYYEYLKFNNPVLPALYCTASRTRVSTKADEEEYSYSASSVANETWGHWASKYAFSTTDDVITFIPSSSNKQFGTMLTRVADVYGYTPTSSQSSYTSGDDVEGTAETSTSGSITVSRNHKSQTTPSGAYYTLNKKQSYIYYDNSTTVPTRMEYESGDARYGNSTEQATYESQTYLLCSKASRGSTFYYTIPVYRTALVWLRFAEAINRAGYPQMAFAILKDGLNVQNLPTHAIRYNTHYVISEVGDTLRNDSGEFVIVTDTIPYLKLNSVGAMYYVDADQLDAFNSKFDFQDDAWNGNYGVHARGCGFGSWTASSEITVRTNIMGYNDSISYDYSNIIRSYGYDPADTNEAILGVEEALVDELALELAFEGFRFTDLVRIANHRNDTGFDGTSWLARKIASRDVRYNSYKDEVTPETLVRGFNQDLFNKLKQTDNWYFDKPAWTY